MERWSFVIYPAVVTVLLVALMVLKLFFTDQMKKRGNAAKCG